MPSFPVYLPQEETFTLVYVCPEKVYGGVPGSKLIEQYGKKPRLEQQRTRIQRTEIKELTREEALNLNKSNEKITLLGLFLPVTKTPENVVISGESYLYRSLLECLEKITEERIICKAQERITKPFQNRTVELAVLPTEAGLVVFGKRNKVYLIKK